MKPQFYPHGPVTGWIGGPGAFMVPAAEYFNEQEAKWWLQDQDATEGWYARLTAPGYLDCTDWMGPYPTIFRAIRDLCRTFEVDLDGFSQDPWDDY